MVVILAIASMMAIPMMSSTGGMQVRSAVNMIAADLEYAKNIAISRQKIYSVVFDEATEGYHIEDANGIIDHPVKKGSQYVVNFKQDSRLNKVDIVEANFDSTPSVKFDYLGSPYNGNNNPLNNGVISLQAGEISMTITIEPVTGYVLVSN